MSHDKNVGSANTPASTPSPEQSAPVIAKSTPKAIRKTKAVDNPVGGLSSKPPLELKEKHAAKRIAKSKTHEVAMPPEESTSNHGESMAQSGTAATGVVTEAELENARRNEEKKFIRGLILQCEADWIAMRMRLAALPHTGDAVNDERRCRDEIGEVAAGFVWFFEIDERFFRLAAWSWPFPLSELIDPAGNAADQITRLIDWVNCLRRFNVLLPEYVERHSRLEELNALGFRDNPHLAELKKIRTAELVESEARLHQGMGGRRRFETTIEQEALKALAIEAMIEAKRTRARAA